METPESQISAARSEAIPGSLRPPFAAWRDAPGDLRGLPQNANAPPRRSALKLRSARPAAPDPRSPRTGLGTGLGRRRPPDSGLASIWLIRASGTPPFFTHPRCRRQRTRRTKPVAVGFHRSSRGCLARTTDVPLSPTWTSVHSLSGDQGERVPWVLTLCERPCGLVREAPYQTSVRYGALPNAISLCAPR